MTMSLVQFWSIVTKGSAQAERGLTWVVGQSLLMIACGLAGWFFPGNEPASGAAAIVSWILLLAGALFGIGGVAVLGRNRTIYPEPREGSTLIQHGIYRYVRHPLYSSVMSLAFAWGLWRASTAAIGLAGVLSIFLVFKARNEEERLIKRFPGYAAYREQVKRFVPWVY